MSSPGAGNRQALIETVFDRVRADRYPSGQLMDLIEPQLDAGQRAEYLALLIDKLGADRFPSLELTRRVSRLLDAWDGGR